MFKNKKGGLGAVIITIVSLIFFFSTYPFWQSAFNEAGSLHSGLLGNIIGFIPFIVLLIVAIKVINLDVGGSE